MVAILNIANDILNITLVYPGLLIIEEFSSRYLPEFSVGSDARCKRSDKFSFVIAATLAATTTTAASVVASIITDGPVCRSNLARPKVTCSEKTGGLKTR